MTVGHLLLKSFGANEAVFQLMMLAYNVFLLFKFDSLSISKYRQQIKTFRLKYVFLAANIIKTAQFNNLRAVGAFLVSSQLKDGNVDYIIIKSEKGRECTIENPWDVNKLIVIKDEKENDIKVVKNNRRFTFKTKPNETYKIYIKH